jgi:hypothetical protein
MDVEIAYRTVTYCMLGNLSYVLGRALTYGMGRERVVNDPEADRLIAASYRAPWEIHRQPIAG